MPAQAYRACAVCLLVLLVIVCPATAASHLTEHPAFRAIREGQVTLLQSLLQQGMPADVQSPNGTTPLMLAARQGSLKMVKLLLAHGADAKAANDVGASALLWGAGHVSIVKALIKAGADPNVASKRGMTPLLAAAGYPDSYDTIKLLLDSGAKLKATSNSSLHALYQAASIGDVRTVRLLLDQGMDPNEGKSFRNALAAAAQKGNTDIVTLLLEEGADPNKNVTFVGSSLNAALLGQRVDIGKKLVEAGAKVNGPRAAGKVPSIMAATYTERGEADLARLLLEKGAKADVTNEAGESSLTWAHLRGFSELIELHKEAGAPEGKLKSKKVPNHDVTLNGKNRQDLLTASIGRSIALLQKSSDAFLRNRENCISCHHQNIPALVISAARDRGFDVDDGSIDRMIQSHVKSWKKDVKQIYEMDVPVPVPPRFLGWGLLGLSALGYPPDEITEAATWYLAAIQQPEGHWLGEIPRPPLGDMELQSTVLAMRSLQLYPLPGRHAEITKRVRMSRNWLRKQEPQTHQERVFQLLGLGWTGSTPAGLKEHIRAVIDAQNKDGSWSQLPELPGDAWATGTSLLALHWAGDVPASDEVYQRGLQFLLRTEYEDGSWFVRTRSWPFQPHFDSRFPHGKSQWISAPATAWATLAMLQAVEPIDDGTVPVRDIYLGGRESPRPAPAEEETGKGTTKVKPGNFDFVGKVKPILERSCVACHSGDKPKASLDMTTRKGFLKGGESGEPAFREGEGKESLLHRVASDSVEDMEMPPPSKRETYPALSGAELETLAAWIDAGAPWPKGLKLEAP